MSFIQLWREVAQNCSKSTSAGQFRAARSFPSPNVAASWKTRTTSSIGGRIHGPMTHSTQFGALQNLRLNSLPFASYTTTASRVPKKVKSSTTSTMKKKVVKKSEIASKKLKGWFGIESGVNPPIEEEEPKVLEGVTSEPIVRSTTRSETLSEWELPEDDLPHGVLQFESPLRGDFTDLSAPVMIPGESGSQKANYDSKMALRKTPVVDVHSDSLELQEVGMQGKLSVDVDPTRKVDLGLDEASKKAMMAARKSGANLIESYMAARDMNDTQMEDAKYGVLPVPPLGSWEAEDVAARRVAEILLMPVYGPSPFYKGRNPALFTHDEAVYFDKYPRTTKNYNKFIWSLCKLGDYPAARAALDSMKAHHVPRDVGVYTSLLQGCIQKKDPREAIRVFVEMRKEGLAADLWAFDSLMEAFVAAGELDGAFALYDELKPNGLKPTTIIFTTLVKGCIKDNDLDRAWKVFEHMRVWHCEPDEVMMNLMIHACALNSEAERALNLYQQMKTMGIRPTQVTFNSLLHACARRKDYYAQAWDLLKTMKTEGYIPDYRTFDMLLAVAGKGGDVATAELVFDEAISTKGPKREQTYAFMIEAYAMAHRVHAEQHNLKKYVEKAERLFDRMVATGIKPTHISLNLRLNLYTYNSMIQRSVEWKKAMKEVYNVQPDVYTYNSMIEMYGRTRKMDLALDQFNLMKAEGLAPTFTTYSILLEGCTRNHLVNTGMKIIREMKAKGIDPKPEHTFIINFRRQLVKTPDLIREIDQITGKAYRFVMPWRKKGNIKKTTYHRELTKEEAKRTSLYG